MFDVQSVLNPQKVLLPLAGEFEGITLELAPFDTNYAFDAKRWQYLALASRIADADEMQFNMGFNRIIGWSGVKDEKGEPIEFTPDNMKALSRLVKAIPLFTQAGLKTLTEAGLVEGQEKKVETKPELPSIENQ